MDNYQISHCPLLGRYLKASRDIKKGELILTDNPLTTGPIKQTQLICPGCYQNELDSTCATCSWPICSQDCPGLQLHSELECAHLLPKNRSLSDFESLSDCLMLVRCLLLKFSSPKKFKRLLQMESNFSKWVASPLHASALELSSTLLSSYTFPSQIPPKLILKIQAILDTNAYEVRVPSSSSNTQAIYLLASLAEHNCTPNTHKVISPSSTSLSFYASCDISQGSHISTSYCDILLPTFHRQQFLLWSKFFLCSCPRCLSPSELDSHLGSLLCPSCNSPSLPILPSPSSPTPYQCSTCFLTIPGNEAHLIYKFADDALTELDKYASLETLPDYEAWLDKWTVLPPESPDDTKTVKLHPQHSLVLDCCHTLFLLYSKEDSAILQRKEQLGHHLLNSTSSLSTGLNKFRGTISYELSLTKASILSASLENGTDSKALKSLSEQLLQLLADSQDLLKLEPLETPEGKLFQSGSTQLIQFNSFFSQLYPK